MKLNKLATTVLLTGFFSCSSIAVSASPLILDNWEMDLSVLNGLNIGTAGLISGAVGSAGIDYLSIDGKSTVVQQISGGSPFGQSFTDSGYLKLSLFNYEGGGSDPLSWGAAGTKGLYGYILFSGLTGIMNADASITFNPNIGNISLWVEQKQGSGSGQDFDPTSTGSNAYELAKFALQAPSGGSNLDFYGGVSGSSTVDLTAVLTNLYVPGLFKDSLGSALDSMALHLINVNSVLVSKVDSVNPQTGSGYSTFNVTNNGSYNVAQNVPEPESMALISLGLISLGISRKMRAKSINQAA